MFGLFLSLFLLGFRQTEFMGLDLFRVMGFDGLLCPFDISFQKSSMVLHHVLVELVQVLLLVLNLLDLDLEGLAKSPLDT